MAVVRKKQDDKYLKVLRELVTAGGGNRQCFDCGQKGPTYVNMTIGSFVCTRCSGVLRGLTPPHRVKSISMATFTQEEVDFLKAHGNEQCAKTWLGLWDPKRAVVQDHRELMIDKYERKRYYLEPASPLKSLTNAVSLKSSSADSSSGSSVTSSNTQQLANVFASNNDRSLKQQKTGIALASPTSQRTAQNGLHKAALPSAISRPQYNSNDNNNNKSSNGFQQQDAFMPQNKNAKSNEFDTNADFVADFSSADIFDVNMSNGSLAAPTSTISLNGYAKIQPMKMQSNGVSGSQPQKAQQNVASGHHNTENFADFDHAPIYNAVAEQKSFVAKPDYQFVRKSGLRRPSASNHAIRLTAGGNGSDAGNGGKDIDEEKMHEQNTQFPKDANNNKECLKSATQDLFSQQNNSLLLGDNLFDDDDDFNFISSSTIHRKSTYDERKSLQTPKLTPLAMAAHATALAVLGNDNHFSDQLRTRQITNESDTWTGGIYGQKEALNSERSKCEAAYAWEKPTSSSAVANPASVPFANEMNPFKSETFPSYLSCKSDSLFDAITVSNSSYMQSKSPQQQQQLNGAACMCSLQPVDSNLLKFPSTNPFVSQLSHPFVSDVNSNFYANSNSINSHSHSTAGQFARSPSSSVNENANFDVKQDFYNSNGWHAPFTNGFNSPMSNSNNNNINGKSNSSDAPAEDRYAALKDLDEQLRESKTVAAVTASAHAIGSAIVDSLGNHGNGNGANPNPFKAQQQPLANPFQTMQPQQRQQPLQPSLHAFDQVSNASQCHPQNMFYNFNNNFYASPMPSSGPNACGFGFGSMQQQMAATAGAFNNPFAAANVLKSNNPFL